MRAGQELEGTRATAIHSPRLGREEFGDRELTPSRNHNVRFEPKSAISTYVFCPPYIPHKSSADPRRYTPLVCRLPRKPTFSQVT
jgi:hypothetical protein